MDKKRIKTELLVHDLKNPIAVIGASVDSLIRKADRENSLTDHQIRVLSRVLRNSKIAMSLVNDILEVGRSREGIFNKDRFKCFEYIMLPFIEIFDLVDPETAEKIGRTEILADFAGILENHDIKVNMDESVWSEEIVLDIRKVRQVFRNLLSNAMKYRKKDIILDVSLDDMNLIISIKDDGKGIEKEYQEKIFEKYFQLGDERNCCIRGHGLGLAGALVLVEDMGGIMTLESEKDKGARFTVRLPLDEQ
ncbi:MAG: HAMP domain-containing sensor histidine kinase [Desulfobacteraceae bacterium]